MSEYRRIYVPLSKEEFIALQEKAQCSYRHPRDQARYILRSVLLGDAEPAGDVLTSEVIAPVCTPEPVYSP